MADASSSRRPKSPSPRRRSPASHGNRPAAPAAPEPLVYIPTEAQMLAALARAQDVPSGRSVGVTVDRPARFNGPRS